MDRNDFDWDDNAPKTAMVEATPAPRRNVSAVVVDESKLSMRFKSLHTLRSWVSRQIRELDAYNPPGDVKAAMAKLGFAKLLSDLMAKTAIEERIVSLERERRDSATQ